MKNSDRAHGGRRDFLRASAALAGAGALGVPAAVASDYGASDAAYDGEVDVLVIGSGAAGCTAAVTAAAGGARVMLVDKAVAPGGTTRMASGVAWIPNNPWLRASGETDHERDCLRYMVRYAYPECYRDDHPTFGLDPARYALLEAFYRNGYRAVEQLEALGATRLTQFELPGGVGPSPDYAAHLPENRTPRGRSVWPRPDAPHGGRGAGLVDGMVAWLRERGAQVHMEHALSELLLEAGRVQGARLSTPTGERRVRARLGVIAATGGFAHAPELLERYQRMAYGTCAPPGGTGDFLLAATAAGAMPGDMQTAWRTQVVLEEALQQRRVGGPVHIPPGDSMFIVNKHGVRVANEKRNYNDRSRVHQEWDPVAVEFPNQFLFLVMDQRTVETYAGNPPLPIEPGDSPHLVRASSPDALAAALQERLDSLRLQHGIAFHLDGAFASALGATIERFNGFARRGVDEDFQRGAHVSEVDWQAHFSRRHRQPDAPLDTMPNPTMYPIDTAGPLYAVILAPGILDTSAGPMIDAGARVLDASGASIPGLYGAGNCVASPTREAYFGAGGTIGPAIAFGYIAGSSVLADHKISATEY